MKIPDCLKILADASSLILLAKTGLLGMLSENSRLIITKEVEEEIDFDSQDSILIKEMILKGCITIQQGIHAWVNNGSKGQSKGNAEGREKNMPDLPSHLHKGERSIILLYQEAGADYLLLDDKSAAAYCKRASIPFINALLVPLLLRQYNVIDEKLMDEKIGQLSGIGRYSKWVREFVEKNKGIFKVNGDRD